MRATRPWFPPSFVPPTTYHRVRMWEYILISLSHTHFSTDQTRDRRIAGSGHQCISMGPALAIHFSPGSAISLLGSWSTAILAFTNTRALAPPHTQTLGQLGTWHWHRHKHTRQSQRGLTRKGESLATNLGDCLVVASGRWCCCTEVFHVASHGRICSSSSGSRVRNHWRKAPHHQGLFAGTFNP